MHHIQPRPQLVLLHEHDPLQRAHRQRATDRGFQDAYRTHRPMVERSIAWLTRGNRRVPYRGIEKNNAWLHHRLAALNLRRLLALGLTTTRNLGAGLSRRTSPDRPHSTDGAPTMDQAGGTTPLSHPEC